MNIGIQASISKKIGYASQQNSVPVLRELKLVNTEKTAATDLTLKLSSDPAFLAEKIWRIDRIDPESTFHIPDRDVRLSAGYLGALNEAVRGNIVLELSAGETVLATEATAVEVLARSEWGGVVRHQNNRDVLRRLPTEASAHLGCQFRRSPAGAASGGAGWFPA